MKKIGIALLLSIATAAMATTPAGWKVVTDRRQTCQYAVPADWSQDRLVSSSSVSPDKKSKVVIHGTQESLADTKKDLQQTITPEKTIEDSGKRFWFTFKSVTGAEGTNWYVGVPVSGGTCAAQISFKDAGAESTMKQIVETVGAAK